MRAPPFLLGCLLVVLAGAAASDSSPADVYCGEDYWFEAARPGGWKARWESTRDGVSVFFSPRAGGPERGVHMLLPAAPAGVATASLDLDRVLLPWVGLASAFGPRPEVDDFELSHPTLPTRALHLRTGSGHVYLVAVDAGGGSGRTFVLNFSSRRAPADATELAALREIVASLRFVPGQSCAPAPDGVAGEIPLAVPASAAPPPP